MQNPSIERILKTLFLKVFLYFVGIRFYKTDLIPITAEFRKAIFRTFQGQEIEFIFYKEIFEDIIYRNGKISKINFHKYIIHSKFTDNLNCKELLVFNNMKFLFDSSKIIINDEAIITDVLLGIYLDFIKHEGIMNKKK